MLRSILGSRGLRLAAVLAPAFLFVVFGAGIALSGMIFDRDEVRESVVRIEVELTQGGARQGTGFIINDKRVIATNNHVIEGAKAIYVTFLANGKPTAIPARLIATDPVGDMALIETIIDIYGEPVVLADYDTSPPAKVTAIGYPVAADFVADNNYLPAIAFEPSYTVGTVARTLSNTKISRRRAADPAHGSDQSRQQRRPAVRRLRPRHRHQHAAHGGQGISTMRRAFSSRSTFASCISCSTTTSSRRPPSRKPCTPGMETKEDLPPATTKEAEAVMFDRFAACVKSRPCDRNICKSRYTNRVATEMVDLRQGDVDVRMAMGEPNCEGQKVSEAVSEFQRCNSQQPCEFEKSCGPKLEEALSADNMKDRRRCLTERAPRP